MSIVTSGWLIHDPPGTREHPVVDTALEAPTLRGRAKADRRAALLVAAARMFAARGFNGVSIEDLGSAVGISGPAMYRHFSGKQAVLAALLVGVSENLLDGGRSVVEQATDDRSALLGLIRFHAEFALGDPHVIRVQDRDLDSLDDPARREVRTLQRRYVELWVEVLSRLNPGVDAATLRVRAHATFGLLNSTPHSDQGLSRSLMRSELERMATVSLG